MTQKKSATKKKAARKSPASARKSGSPRDPSIESEPPKPAPESPFTRLISATQVRPFDEGHLTEPLKAYILEGLQGHEAIFDNYNVLIFYDTDRLVRSDADKLYRAVQAIKDRSKPILLVVQSPGGSIEPAYLMSKLCRSATKNEFHVAVPRRAKSAATLLACGADRIHMGAMSELGPIDPQIGKIPVLSLKSALEHVGKLSKETPQASDMFASYLSRVLKIEQLGHYERVAESAVQYAERLIGARRLSAERDAKEIAVDLVYQYKDHGFVIDSAEATHVFGKNTIVVGSEEYRFSDALYERLKTAAWVVEQLANHRLYFVGDLDNCANAYEIRRK